MQDVLIEFLLEVEESPQDWYQIILRQKRDFLTQLKSYETSKERRNGGDNGMIIILTPVILVGIPVLLILPVDADL